MILVDTSVWVDHLRRGDKQLAQLLAKRMVCTHPMIIGELACGNLKNRKQLITLWHNLPTVTEARHEEVTFLLESHSLMGKGIGYVDLHLLGTACFPAAPSCGHMTNISRRSLILSKLDFFPAPDK